MVQKKIFEAGLGDVHVAQFDAGSGGEIGDLGDERATAISVEVGAAAIRGAHFSNARQCLEALQKFRGVKPKRKRSK